MITTKVFKHHMNAMREHHKSGATHRYALPVALMAGADLSGVDAPVSQETTTAVEAAQALMTNFSTNQQQGVTDAKAKLQSDKASGVAPDTATAAFAKKMQDLKDKAKKDSDAKIDEMYNNLIDVGTKHPDQQQHILTATEAIGAFFTNLIAKIATFFDDLGKQIVAWFKSVGDWFEKAGEAIKDWFDGAARSVGNFFSSIF